MANHNDGMCPGFQNRVGVTRWHVPAAFTVTYGRSVLCWSASEAETRRRLWIGSEDSANSDSKMGRRAFPIAPGYRRSKTGLAWKVVVDARGLMSTKMNSGDEPFCTDTEVHFN